MKKILTTFAMFAMGYACWAEGSVKVVTPQEFQTLTEDTTAVILDVRKPAEFTESHLKGAINVDWLDSATFNQRVQDLDTTRTYLIYCRSGRRSNAAAKAMSKQGFKTYDLQGGILRWKAEGMKVVK